MNYLNNKELMKNILLSKASYTWYIDGTYKDTKYLNYDIIVCGGKDVYEESKRKFTLQKINSLLRQTGEKKEFSITDENYNILSQEDVDEIESKIILFDGNLTEELLEKAKFAHVNRLRYENGSKRFSNMEDALSEMEKVKKEDIVIRVHTFDHIPIDTERKKSKKKAADRHADINFHPYQHYAYHEGEFKCVAKSHMTKDMEFSTRHGKINHQLASSFIVLCRRYASRHNWRGYSYADDMQGQALCQLTAIGLQFNEMFSNNPFSYYTTGIKNAFTSILNEEKKNQETRDQILMNNNKKPSWTKQLESEMSRDEHWDRVLDNNNMDAENVTDEDVDFHFDADPEDIDTYEEIEDEN